MVGGALPEWYLRIVRERIAVVRRGVDILDWYDSDHTICRRQDGERALHVALYDTPGEHALEMLELVAFRFQRQIAWYRSHTPLNACPARILAGLRELEYSSLDLCR
jgi:hypothetical protein